MGGCQLNIWLEAGCQTWLLVSSGTAIVCRSILHPSLSSCNKKKMLRHPDNNVVPIKEGEIEPQGRNLLLAMVSSRA